MEPIIKKTLEKPQKELENYCNTTHNFFDIFPRDEYDFNGKSYTQYFYFDKKEASLYFNDYKKFIVKNYQINMFRADHYYSTIDQFAKYLEKHNVYFNNRTVVGINMSVKNNLGLAKILKALDQSVMFNDPQKPVIFSFGEVDVNKPYALDFFDYAEQKLNGYYYDKNHIIEPLVGSDLVRLKGVFRGEGYVGELPFFINPNYKHAKTARTMVLNNFVESTLVMSWVVSNTATNKIVSLVGIIKQDNSYALKIICDSEYYDISFSDVVGFIAKYAFKNLGVTKLTCFNDNIELAYSTLNSSLTVAGFKPNYLQEAGEHGYSKIEYVLNSSDYTDKELANKKSKLVFNF